MPNFDLTTIDGVGFFFQIFVSGFAFLQIYRMRRGLKTQMSEIQWFGNSLLLSLFVISVSDWVIKHASTPPPQGVVMLGLINIFFGMILGLISAEIVNKVKKIFG